MSAETIRHETVSKELSPHREIGFPSVMIDNRQCIVSEYRFR